MEKDLNNTLHTNEINMESANTVLVPFQDETTKLWGYKLNDCEVISPVYDEARPFGSGFAWVRKACYKWLIDVKGNKMLELILDDGCWVLIDDTGNELGRFSVIEDYADGRIKAKINLEWGYINEKGETLIPFEYSTIKDFVKGIAKAEKNGRWGYINKSGDVVIPFEFDEIGEFNDGKARAKKKGLWGYIDEKGKTIVPFKYSIIEEYVDGKAKVKKKGRWGYINEKGKKIVPFKYSVIEEYVDGKAKAEKDGRWGYIDEKGKTVVSFKYSVIEEYVDGKAKAEKNGRWGYINGKGQEVYSHKKMSNGIIVYSSSYKEKCGLMKENGDRITGLNYVVIEDFVDGKAKAEKKVMDIQLYISGIFGGGFFGALCVGPLVFICIEDYNWHSFIITDLISALIFVVGVAVVFPLYNIVKRWGYINEKGRTIVPFKYSVIEKFVDGKAKAEINKKCGYLNEKGKVVIPFIYDEIGDFVDGRAIVSKGYGKEGYIDENGDEIIPTIFTVIENFVNGKAKAMISWHNDNGTRDYKIEKWGYINEKGVSIIPFEFDEIGEFIDGKAKARKMKRWGFINENGQEVYSHKKMSNGLIVYSSSIKGMCGLMKESGEIITGLDFDAIEEFVDGKAKASKGYGQWGYINDKGETIIPFEFSAIEEFVDGKVKAEKKYGWGYINEKGKTIIPFEFRRIEKFVDGKAKAEKDGKWGYINERGEEVFEKKVLQNGLVEYTSYFNEIKMIKES